MNRRCFPSSKRRHAKLKHEEEESINDLAVAASFAIQPLSIVPNPDEDNGNISDSSGDCSDSSQDGVDDTVNKAHNNRKEKMDADDVKSKSALETLNIDVPPEKIDSSPLVSIGDKNSNLLLEENQLNTKESTQSSEETKDANPQIQNEDVESDDESDVDLSESLAKMEDELHSMLVAPNKKGVEESTKSSLKTEHELDINSCSLEDLGKQLDLDLRVDEEKEKQRLQENVSLVLAGHVKSFLIDERIIVVESNCGGFTNRDALDEGCLLIMKVDNSMLENNSAETSPQNKSVLIPVAKIFEVFGPVVKPLYTLRLPSKESYEKHKEKNESGDIKNQSENNNNEVAKLPENKGVKESNSTGDLSSSASYDPWSKTGIYTQILSNNPKMQMYFDQSNMKKINTEAIIRTSGKGSDASNIYDEEVMKINEIDFSDDEAEREAKQRRKKSNKNRMHERVNNATRNTQFKSRQDGRVSHKYNNRTNNRTNNRVTEKCDGTNNFPYQQTHSQIQTSMDVGQHPNMVGGQQPNWPNYQNSFPQTNMYPPIHSVPHQPPNFNVMTEPPHSAMYSPHQNSYPHPNLTNQPYANNQNLHPVYNQNSSYQNQVYFDPNLQNNPGNNINKQNDNDTVYYNYTE